MRLGYVVALITFGCASIAGAVEAPPRSPFDSIDWPMTMRFAPSKGAVLGRFQITFERTTLDAIRAEVGMGAVSHSGGGADSLLWLCYTVATATRRERLWIASSAEMGGSNHAVTLVTAVVVDAVGSDPDCPLLPKRLTPVALDHGIWLGSSSRDLTRSLGTPSHVAAPWNVYDFLSKVAGNGKCDGGYDRINWLDAKLNGRAVIEISAGQVTSC